MLLGLWSLPLYSKPAAWHLSSFLMSPLCLHGSGLTVSLGAVESQGDFPLVLAYPRVLLFFLFTITGNKVTNFRDLVCTTLQIYPAFLRKANTLKKIYVYKNPLVLCNECRSEVFITCPKHLHVGN